jgi:hypothetical protein
MAGDDIPRHPKTDPAVAGLPGIVHPAHDSYLETSYSDGPRTTKPREALDGQTVLADLPIESGSYRPPRMQTAYFERRPNFLGEMPYSGLHGRVVPLAQPSDTQGDPDYYEQGYLIRQVPSSSSDDLGLVV